MECPQRKKMEGAFRPLERGVKDAKQYAATGGWGYASFDQDGKPSPASAMQTCFPCHQAVSERDFIFTRYAP